MARWILDMSDESKEQGWVLQLSSWEVGKLEGLVESLRMTTGTDGMIPSLCNFLDGLTARKPPAIELFKDDGS